MYAILILLSILIFTAPVKTQFPSRYVDHVLNIPNGDLSSCDIDGDNIADVVLGSLANPTRIYWGSFQGPFFLPFVSLPQQGPATCRDVNGDRYADVVIMDVDGNATIYLGYSRGVTYHNTTRLTVGSTSQPLLIDYNSDNITDIVISGPARVQFFSGILAGGLFTFNTTADFSFVNGRTFLTSGDPNGDGLPDVLFAHATADNPIVLTNRGPGATPPFLAQTYTSITTKVATGLDINGDNFDDYLLGVGPRYLIAYGSSSGTISPNLFSGMYTTPVYTFALPDCNADGFAEYLVCEFSKELLQVYTGNATGLGTLALQYENLTGAGLGYYMSYGDYDGQGSIDIIVGSANGTLPQHATIVIYNIFQSIVPSITPTPSPTPSITPSITPTPSRTPSTTPSTSSTPSRTPTPSVTPSRSPSSTPSITPTPSVTPSITPSSTPSRTSSPSNTPSSSPSSTPSVSSSPSSFPSPSRTPSISPSTTPTPSPSSSVSPSSTPSISSSPSSFPSPSRTPSISPSRTPSPVVVSPSPAFNSTGRWYISVDCYGDLPRYELRTRYGRQEKYQVFFHQLHELKNGRINGKSQVSLPKLKWRWTQPVLANNQWTFSFKGTAGRRNHIQFESIEFNHTIQATANFLDIKFDVDIEDYDWETDSKYERSLRLVYSLKDLLRRDNDDVVVLNGTRGYLSRLYVGIGSDQTTANITDGSSTYKVNVSVTAQDNKVRMVYSGFTKSRHFDRLFHDPVIGVDSPLTPEDEMAFLAYQNESMVLIVPPPTSGDQSVSYQKYAIYGGIGAGVLVFIVAVIVAVVMRVKRAPPRIEIDLPSTEDY